MQKPSSSPNVAVFDQHPATCAQQSLTWALEAKSARIHELLMMRLNWMELWRSGPDDPVGPRSLTAAEEPICSHDSGISRAAAAAAAGSPVEK